MRRLLCLGVAAILAIALSSCGGGGMDAITGRDSRGQAHLLM